MLQLISLIAFGAQTRPKREPAWGDELMFGNWTIQSYDLESNENIGKYNVHFKPHPTQDALIGNLTQLSASDEPIFYQLILRFNGTDRDTFKAYYIEDGEEIHITDVALQFSEIPLHNAFGQILGTNLTYSLNMFSFLNIEITTYDTNTNEITVYKMTKPDPMPPGKDFKTSIFAIATIAYLFFRKRDQAAAEAAQNPANGVNQEGEAKNDGNEGQAQPQQRKKGKGKKNK